MTRNTLRYDWYGALIGLGLPMLGSVLEAVRLYHSVTPQAILRAHLDQPLLWIMDTTPFVLGMLGRIILIQQAKLVRQGQQLFEKGQELVALEQARRESFEGAAGKLFHFAQGLAGTVSDFTATTGEAAGSVRRVTETMNGLSQAASAAALTADTVIGIGVQAERASADGLRQVEASGADLARFSEEVQEFASAVDGLSRPLSDLREQSAAVAELSAGADRLLGLAAQAEKAGVGGRGEPDLLGALRAHAETVRRSAGGLELLLGEVQRVKDAATRAAQAGGERADASARLATRTRETIRGLAISLRESARAAREIARVAQQQEGDIEQVLVAMNEIAHATAGTVVTTQHVENEARSLNDLAASLRDAVNRE
jgi:methyl-accepting chemotaxis protein